MDIEALLEHRAEHDRFLAGHYASPVPEEHRADFAGLDYFDPEPAWAMTGRWEEAEPHEMPIRSSTGTDSTYTQVGIVVLSIAGGTYRLAVLDDGDGGRFIPFRDGTCGLTTYSGGRYVGIEVAEDDSALVDFNRAANPWCVYDDEFSCPLAPPANWITDPIEAGEKMWRPTVGQSRP